jgi:hypothetical protein
LYIVCLHLFIYIYNCTPYYINGVVSSVVPSAVVVWIIQGGRGGVGGVLGVGGGWCLVSSVVVPSAVVVWIIQGGRGGVGGVLGVLVGIYAADHPSGYTQGSSVRRRSRL